jgi:N-acetylmuramoyl-L-alanine amidase
VDAPSATCVAGFLSCPAEDRLLAAPDYREQVAAGIARGIADFVRDSTATEHTAREEALGD